MIAELLNHGADNAQTARDLSRLLGMDPRDITRAIESERRAGRLICASTGRIPGYYLPASEEEARQYERRLSRRIREISRTHEAITAAMNTKGARA